MKDSVCYNKPFEHKVYIFFITNFQIVQEKQARAIRDILLLTSNAHKNIFDVRSSKIELKVIIIIKPNQICVNSILL